MSDNPFTDLLGRERQQPEPTVVLQLSPLTLAQVQALSEATGAPAGVVIGVAVDQLFQHQSSGKAVEPKRGRSRPSR